MNKVATVFLMFLVVSLSRNLAEESLLLGGYEVIELSAINDAEEYKEIQSIISFAKEDYSKKNEEPLGQVVAISRQLVAGWNYKIIFEIPEGYVQIIVFDQSWTQTREVTDTQRLATR